MNGGRYRGAIETTPATAIRESVASDTTFVPVLGARYVRASADLGILLTAQERSNSDSKAVKRSGRRMSNFPGVKNLP